MPNGSCAFTAKTEKTLEFLKKSFLTACILIFRHYIMETTQ